MLGRGRQNYVRVCFLNPGLKLKLWWFKASGSGFAIKIPFFYDNDTVIMCGYNTNHSKKNCSGTALRSITRNIFIVISMIKVVWTKKFCKYRWFSVKKVLSGKYHCFLWVDFQSLEIGAWKDQSVNNSGFLNVLKANGFWTNFTISEKCYFANLTTGGMVIRYPKGYAYRRVCK